ncbi:uncharacterized protein Dvar_66290 [Desulfosarcina variabilis str. Montpellier]
MGQFINNNGKLYDNAKNNVMKRPRPVQQKLCIFCYLVSVQKWPIFPISALREKFNPRNINHMPVVKFFGRLDLNQIFLFLDGHYLGII